MNTRVNPFGGADRWDVSINLHYPSQAGANNQNKQLAPGAPGNDPLDIDSGVSANSPSKKSSRAEHEADADKKAVDLGLLLQVLQIIYLLNLQDKDDAVPKTQAKDKGKGGGGGGSAPTESPERFNAGWDGKETSLTSDPRTKPPAGKPRSGADDDSRHEETARSKDRTQHVKGGDQDDKESSSVKGGKGSRSAKTEEKSSTVDRGNETATKTEKSSKASGPSAMPEPTGTVTVNETIVVKSGETFDGGGKHYKAGASLGDGGQGEGQKPVFVIEPGGTLKNMQYSGADGIHTMGDATIKDVWARDVGEDAMTMKKPGNVTWSGGGAFNANDKIFQLNAGGSFTLENFTADGFGKAIRTNGGKQIDTDITVRNSDFKNGKEAIVRTDSLDARIKLEGVTFSNVPNDVLAPDGTSVIGAVARGKK